jgi:ferritin-like metal-binding protein YciE
MKRNTQTEDTQTKSSAENTKPSQKEKSAGAAGNEGLMKVFEEELKDIYGAEKQLMTALPEMMEAAKSEDLKQAFEEHLEQTKEQAKRIEQIFSMLSIDREAKKCKAMAGLIEEGKDIIKDFEKGSVRDSALIIGAQKIEHYEIAAYGSLCELAEVLGKHKVANLLDITLEEEEETDSLLTKIAESVNDCALEDSGNNESDENETKTADKEDQTADITA